MDHSASVARRKPASNESGLISVTTGVSSSKRRSTQARRGSGYERTSRRWIAHTPPRPPASNMFSWKRRFHHFGPGVR